jgi:hypothetical protein
MDRPLDRPQTTVRRHMRDVSPLCSVVGRVLLVTVAVLSAVMPLTEHFWKADLFPRGGEDFEMSLLALLALLCMVLLVAQYLKEAIATLLAFQESHSLDFPPGDIGRQGLAFEAAIGLSPKRIHGPSLYLREILRQV